MKNGIRKQSLEKECNFCILKSKALLLKSVKKRLQQGSTNVEFTWNNNGPKKKNRLKPNEMRLIVRSHRQEQPWKKRSSNRKNNSRKSNSYQNRKGPFLKNNGPVSVKKLVSEQSKKWNK